MAWRTAGSILQLHAQLKQGAPAAAAGTPADAWGTIGDAAHDPTSDHTPHDFPGWGDDIVTAGDFPDVPALGLDARKVLDDIRRSRDDRVKYGISHGQMFSSYPTSSYPAWTWRPYSGSDGHFTHGHLSVVGDARADDRRPWATLGGIMALDTDEKAMLTEIRDRLRWIDPRMAAAADGTSTYRDPAGVVKRQVGVELQQAILSKLEQLQATAGGQTVTLSDADREGIAALVVQQLADAELVFRVQPAA